MARGVTVDSAPSEAGQTDSINGGVGLDLLLCQTRAVGSLRAGGARLSREGIVPFE